MEDTSLLSPHKCLYKRYYGGGRGRFDATHCSGKRTCIAGKRCSSHELWNDLNEVVQDYLSRIYIFDLVDSPINTNIDTKEIN